MQDETITKTQVIGMQNGLICVLNIAAECLTPGFVTDDPSTVRAG